MANSGQHHYIEYKCRHCGHVERSYGGRSDWCPSCGKPYFHTEFMNRSSKEIERDGKLAISCIIGVVIVFILIIVGIYFLITWIF